VRRLLTIGAAIAICLVLGGGQVAAQTATQLRGTSTTAAQECENILAKTIVCTWTASDPRLSGTLTHEWTNVPGEPAIGWAPATLDGPDGSWAGHLYATWTDPARLFVFLSGEGDYDGWQYVASTIDDAERMGNSEWVGVVYEGEPPPYGPPDQPAD